MESYQSYFGSMVRSTIECGSSVLTSHSGGSQVVSFGSAGQKLGGECVCLCFKGQMIDYDRSGSIDSTIDRDGKADGSRDYTLSTQYLRVWR